MTISVEAELKRQAASGGGLVSWELVLDALSATGRADPVIDTGARASLSERYGGGLTPVTATVTALGDTVIDAAPGLGFKIKFYWVTAITDPDQATAPLIIIKASGGTEYYRAFAVAHWEPFILPENTALAVNLSEASSVAVTVHRKIVAA